MNNRGKPKSLFICPQKHYAVDCTGDDSTGADPTGDYSTGADSIGANSTCGDNPSTRA